MLYYFTIGLDVVKFSYLGMVGIGLTEKSTPITPPLTTALIGELILSY
jgi:hypothetical protein